MQPLVFYPRSTLGRHLGTPKHQSDGENIVESVRPETVTFDARTLSNGTVFGISNSGDYIFFEQDELAILLNDPGQIHPKRRAELAARFFLPNHGRSIGKSRLLLSRRAAKRETVSSGPSLHIIVPTLQCGHTCQYCQVSRAQSDAGFSMSPEILDAACDRIWESSADVLTVEFQGGDPLLRFDLIVRAIERFARMNHDGRKRFRFVVASTLHQLSEEMCEFFRIHGVVVSTSLDGPEQLHNRNRPIPGRDSYKRTLDGIALARKLIGVHSVSALMTTTRLSLEFPEQIVDEYVNQGFNEIFLRPLSIYGFAKRNLGKVGYSEEEFHKFYERALRRVLWWNEQDVPIREVYMSIVMNKILSTFDAGYVDLQSPTGAGSSVLVYNYDGWVYPSDEARMLVETGDVSLRMGRVTDTLDEILCSETRRQLIHASEVSAADCKSCAFRHYCAPNPVDSQAQFGRADVPAHQTEHCSRHQWLFDSAFSLLHAADTRVEEMFHIWARPAESSETLCAK